MSGHTIDPQFGTTLELDQSFRIGVTRSKKVIYSMRAVKTFRLTGYFSMLSFVLILIAGGALGLSAQHQATRQVTNMAQRHNEAMSQVFIKAMFRLSVVDGFFAEILV